jgi:hypothetical protein
MRLFFVCLSCVFLSAPAFASPEIYYSTQKNTLMANGKVIDRHFWSMKYDLEDVFTKNPAAQAEYLEYEKYITWSPYLNWGAAVAGISYAIISTNNDNYSSGTFWGIFLVPWVAGMIVTQKANIHLERAINLYNGVDPSLASVDGARGHFDSKDSFSSPTFALNVWNYSF